MSIISGVPRAKTTMKCSGHFDQLGFFSGQITRTSTFGSHRECDRHGCDQSRTLIGSAAGHHDHCTTAASAGIVARVPTSKLGNDAGSSAVPGSPRTFSHNSFQVPPALLCRIAKHMSDKCTVPLNLCFMAKEVRGFSKKKTTPKAVRLQR